MSKVSWKYIFVGFQQQFSKVNLLLWKKAVLHTTTLTHWYILGDLSGTNQGNSLEMTFVAGATKINLKIWKTSYDWMTWCRKQPEGINNIGMEDLNLWQILGEVLLELIR